MTALDTATARLVEQLQQAAAPETSATEHEARLVRQVELATIARCQLFIREAADMLEVSFRQANLPIVMVTAYRSAAELLEALRS